MAVNDIRQIIRRTDSRKKTMLLRTNPLTFSDLYGTLFFKIIKVIVAAFIIITIPNIHWSKKKENPAEADREEYMVLNRLHINRIRQERFICFPYRIFCFSNPCQTAGDEK